MKLQAKQAPVPADPRLVGVVQASMQDVETAVAVSQAPTAAAAWDELAGQQVRRVLVQACLDADTATTRGHDAVRGLVDAGTPVPASWLERLVVLEHARLECVWRLEDWDAAHRPAALLASVGPDTDLRAPSVLAVRTMQPAMKRLGEIDPPPGQWLTEANAEIDRHAPGWDTESLRLACQELVGAAVHAKYAAPVTS